MYSRQYKGYNIEKNIHGYYRTYLYNEGRFVMADTLAGIKKMIDKDKKRM